MKHAEIVLSGGYSAYGELQEFIDAFACDMSYGRNFTDDLQLSLKEAFVNAVKHGNGERQDLPVRCTLTSAGHRLEASVRDCGAWFDAEALPDPCIRSYRMKLSGRGVHIIRSKAELAVIEHEGAGKTLLMSYLPAERILNSNQQ